MRQLIMGEPDCHNSFFMGAAWALINQEVDNIIEHVGDEYNTLDVYGELHFGTSTLLLFYAPDIEELPPQEKQQEMVINTLAGREPSKDFAGFLIYRLNRAKPMVHIWQAFSKPEFTEAVPDALARFEKLVKTFGAKSLTFASSRRGWGANAAKFGFSEGQTIYRKGL